MSEEAAVAFRAAVGRMNNPERRTIELDCPPGNPRPSDLIAGVLEGTGLPQRDPVAKVFGNWIWDYTDLSEQFDTARPTMEQRIRSLYKSGAIRYGSW